MGLALADKWLWDFWFAQDKGDYHVFYLQAPNTLEHESKRHFNVSVGHAVSKDLRNWTVLTDALHPSPAESDALDNYTTWTGSIINHEGLWYMFYTGSSRKEKGLIQRIFLATSKDLLSWNKHGEPVIEADPRWYELLDLDAWFDQAWRDPWVFRDDKGIFHAFITARTKAGPKDARGVIAHARSKDLLKWEVLPPVTEPGEFGYLEVPQVEKFSGHYYMLFSVTANIFSDARKASSAPESGTHYLVAENLLGPYELTKNEFMQGDAHGSLYSGKFIKNPAGQLVFMAFENFTTEGEFLGKLSDPYPVTALPHGELKVATKA